VRRRQPGSQDSASLELRSVLRSQCEEQQAVVNVSTEADDPSPGNGCWRHSRLRRLSTCCSELKRV
jgi:hypothetical protein